MASIRAVLTKLFRGERRRVPRDPEAAAILARQDQLALRLARIERIRRDARLATRRLGR